jgi:hypothetical protein
MSTPSHITLVTAVFLDTLGISGSWSCADGLPDRTAGARDLVSAKPLNVRGSAAWVI